MHSHPQTFCSILHSLSYKVNQKCWSSPKIAPPSKSRKSRSSANRCGSYSHNLIHHLKQGHLYQTVIFARNFFFFRKGTQNLGDYTGGTSQPHRKLRAPFHILKTSHWYMFCTKFFCRSKPISLTPTQPLEVEFPWTSLRQSSQADHDTTTDFQIFNHSIAMQWFAESDACWFCYLIFFHFK